MNRSFVTERRGTRSFSPSAFLGALVQAYLNR
ncbi:hypothetical protein HRbin17_02674 [bacterium HR17]|uniref:Uncharacterized protein n=1 Tax=Candidatus Fervidibacter japonicus TaxID=2035412 RepID=A0A2H5XG35_9BACT|nr:hypothetical protein HRbin17_02674 [bacterium HR17]